MSEIIESDDFKRAADGEYSHHIIACDPIVRGFAVCTLDGKCKTCPYALAHLNPDIPLYIFTKGEEQCL